MVTKKFKVEGMTCNSCANLIELKLKDKVDSVSASFSNGEVEVDFESNKISEKRVIELIENDGEFKVVLNKEVDKKVVSRSLGDRVGFFL